MDFEHARFNMVEQQIRPWDVLDQGVLDVLASLKREFFVPPAFQSLAFSDTEIALTASGARTGEIMLAPKVEARVLQELAVTKTDSVLEIGSGSGFMAALLAKQALHVVSLEINPTLVQIARQNLSNAHIRNVEVMQKDGSSLANDSAMSSFKFDIIVLSGSVEFVEPSLLEHLNVGGRLAAFVGHAPVMQAQLLRKTRDRSIVKTIMFETDVPRLKGFSHVSSFVF